MIDRIAMGGRFVTHVTIVTPPSNSPTPIIGQDMRRYYLRFDINGPVVNNTQVRPAVVDWSSFAFGVAELSIESKWSEQVSLTTGEWVAINCGGVSIIITEVIEVE